MKDVLPSENYEIFKVYVPLKVIFQNRIKQFICAQLGNLYPGFTERSCYDYSIQFNQKGLLCSVVVMERFLLNEYLKADGKRGVKIREFKFKRFFRKKGSAGFVRLILLLALIAVIFFAVNKALFNRQNIKSTGQSTSVKNTELQNDACFPVKETYDSLVPDFFDSLWNTDGTIRSFEWKFDGLSERISADVKGFYPDVLNIEKGRKEISSVTYENKIPAFSISYEKPVPSGYFLKYKEDLSVADAVKNQLRQLISDCGGNHLGETMNPCSFQFECPSLSFCRLFNELNAFVLQDNISLTRITVRQKNNSLFLIELSMADSFIDDNAILEKLALSEKYFFKVEENQTDIAESKALVQVKGTEKKKNDIKESKEGKNMKKIGIVNHGNGNVISVYKDEKGKILMKNNQEK